MGILKLSLKLVGNISINIPAEHPIKTWEKSITNVKQNNIETNSPINDPSMVFLIFIGLGVPLVRDNPTNDAIGSPIDRVKTPIAALSKGNRLKVRKTPVAYHKGVLTMLLCSSSVDAFFTNQVNGGIVFPESRRYSELR